MLSLFGLDYDEDVLNGSGGMGGDASDDNEANVPTNSALCTPIAAETTCILPRVVLSPSEVESILNAEIGEDVHIDTKELAEQVLAELRQRAIPRYLFAEVILNRSVDSLKSVLSRPTPWGNVKSGQITYRRMYNWMKQPIHTRLALLGHVPKRKKRRFTAEQREILMAAFRASERPSRKMKQTLAQRLHVDYSRVTQFFADARQLRARKIKSSGDLHDHCEDPMAPSGSTGVTGSALIITGEELSTPGKHRFSSGSSCSSITGSDSAISSSALSFPKEAPDLGGFLDKRLSAVVHPLKAAELQSKSHFAPALHSSHSTVKSEISLDSDEDTAEAGISSPGVASQPLSRRTADNWNEHTLLQRADAIIRERAVQGQSFGAGQGNFSRRDQSAKSTVGESNHDRRRMASSSRHEPSSEAAAHNLVTQEGSRMVTRSVETELPVNLSLSSSLSGTSLPLSLSISGGSPAFRAAIASGQVRFSVNFSCDPNIAMDNDFSNQELNLLSQSGSS